MRDVPLLSFTFKKFHYFVMPVTILGIDTSKHCGPLSNIDLVHFVWEHFFVSVTKNSHWLSHLAALLSFQNCFWNITVQKATRGKTLNCDGCVERHKAVVEPFHLCYLSPECTCKICTRQPPTLADSARHVLFNYTLYIDSFKLTIEKTFSIRICCRSNRVPQDNLLPPETPTIRLWFLYDVNSPYKHHHDCPVAGSWDSNSVKTYTTNDAMIEDLISLKEHFWCYHCERGSSSPILVFYMGKTLLYWGDAEEEFEEEEEEIEE